MISTHNLSSLPNIDALKKLLQSMAMLDAILMPEWTYRYYSFNAHWSKNEQMGSMRNGSGDDFYALFNEAGCFLKGFVHDAPIIPYRDQSPQIFPNILENVPAAFEECLHEPAFKMTDTTFCIWRRYSDNNWQQDKMKLQSGNDFDGSMSLLSPLDGSPKTYKIWAEEYYERSVNLKAITAIYTHTTLSQELIDMLNDDLSLDDLQKDCDEIGYPSTSIIVA
ncbi:MAG: hypothetical protein IPP74_14065 [Alphaproteobacteria bacterium]|nr:hypothetical protein [Alphaproteobacteria bacterium]